MSARDFRLELPVADIRIGRSEFWRIYGDPELTPALVEIRKTDRYGTEHVHLKVEQAEAIAHGLLAAAAKARGGA